MLSVLSKAHQDYYMNPKTSAPETRVLKLVAALLISLSCAAIINAQTCEPPEITDWARDEVKGPVKTSKTFATTFVVSKKTGRLEKRRRLLQREAEYDAKGNRDGGDGGITFSVPPGMEFTGARYVCANNGKLKELRFVAKDGSTYPRTTYVYDEKGRTTEETYLYQDGSLEVKTTYVYDDAGNVIEEVRKSHIQTLNSYLTTKHTYRYDARGNKIEAREFSGDGVLYNTWFFSYDSNDRMIKETYRDKFGRLDRQVFHEYDADGRKLEDVYYANSCTTRETVSCKAYISTGDGFFTHAFKTKYKYDSQGNWIKQTEWYMDGERTKSVWELSEIVEREINYHRN
jgi:hypothetical protein